MIKKPFTIGAVQMRMSQEVQANVEHACELLGKAAKLGAEIVCLPELFRSPYFCQTEDPEVFNLAESIPGPTTEALAKVAKQQGIAIIGSLFERRAAGIYHNTAVIIDADGQLVGIYRKMHIPDDPLYYEKYYFTPGDLGFKAFDTQFGRIGTLVCWDQWYPEGARLTSLQDPSVLFYPTAIGWHPSEKQEYGAAQVSAWETIQRSHAIANGIYVAAVNRIGFEPTPENKGDGIEFFGNSFIADPFGRILAKASQDQEEILTAVVDPKLQEVTRRHWPFLRDRRIDAYSNITERFGK
ncbi:MAG TPA: carbon-nitrogen hydrolase [Gammaproteobacteria bacterium]|nr:carbon-nitrogen hydrolase [Gammaproteobacteria bacterium]